MSKKSRKDDDIGRAYLYKRISISSEGELQSLLSSKRKLRNWWHETIGKYGKFSCAAFILTLPLDKFANRYLRDHTETLNIISGDDCLVIGLSAWQLSSDKKDFNFGGSDEKIKQLALEKNDFSEQDLLERQKKGIEEEVKSNGYSAQIAQYFDISFEEFPCLVLFENMHSTRHMIVSLKDMNVDEIDRRLRQIFTVIRDANNDNQNPIEILEEILEMEHKQERRSNIFNGIRKFADKTYETAITALVASLTL